MSDQDLSAPTTDPFAVAGEVVVDVPADATPEEVAEAVIEAEEAIEDEVGRQ